MSYFKLNMQILLVGIAFVLLSIGQRLWDWWKGEINE